MIDEMMHSVFIYQTSCSVTQIRGFYASLSLSMNWCGGRTFTRSGAAPQQDDDGGPSGRTSPAVSWCPTKSMEGPHLSLRSRPTSPPDNHHDSSCARNSRFRSSQRLPSQADRSSQAILPPWSDVFTSTVVHPTPIPGLLSRALSFPSPAGLLADHRT